MFGHGWGGHEPAHQRLFERGAMKYVVLELLKEKPRHGYEVIRALQDRFGGWYSPSPGAVYPTLAMLADMNYVTVEQQDGKKIYAIAPAGERFLAERSEVVDGIRQRMSTWWAADARGEFNDMRREMREFGRLFDRRLREQWRDPDKLRRIRAVIARARGEIEAILADEVRA
ncbi:MAG: hypothetical protein QOF51_564 [Chloroflexota bacterium]|jgi:DNA-binding PadR family transcriptional regulator|nr:hypothetical protein [Chloroflexota bacterium]